jgi:hypothetical protein
VTTNTDLEAERLRDVANALDAGVPFSIACFGCDAGQEIGEYAVAVARGWEGIVLDRGGLGWNFLGSCPECIAMENQ